MGPAIILDKSAMQSLSEVELHFLYKYYYVVIPPILILEILGDIQKGKDISHSKQQVIYLANKFSPFSSSINVPYFELIRGELSGNQITMDGRPLVSNQPSVNPDGKLGAIVNPTPEDEAIERWRYGNFKKDDELYSKIWRFATTNIDLEEMKRKLAPIFSGSPKATSSTDIMTIVEEEILTSTSGMELLYWVAGFFLLDEDLLKAVLERYNINGFTSLEQFAPYTSYCLRATLYFYVGLVSGLFSTKGTNLLDLEYLYYLPFTIVFSSGDNLHKKLCPLLLGPNQRFIKRMELKADLKNMAEEWLNLKEETRQMDWEEKYGRTPPKDAESPTYQVWEHSKHRNLSDSFSVEGAMSAPSPIEPDFIEIRRDISIFAPCPCGSGKKFKDCHQAEVDKSK